MTNRIRSASAALLFLGSLVTLTSGFNLSNLSPRLASLSTAAKPAQRRVAPGLEATRHGPGRELPAAPTAQVVKAYGKLPLFFEANQGQTDPHVKFLARGAGYTLFLTEDEAVLALRSTNGRKQKAERRKKDVAQPSPFNPAFPRFGSQAQAADLKGRSVLPGSANAREGESRTEAVLRMKLVGANPNVTVSGTDELLGKSNYFIGNDPKKWRTDVPNYAKVRYEGVYPGVDLVYYGNQGQLEYDFVVAPGGDPHGIMLGIETGISKFDARHSKIVNPKSKINAPLRIAANGDLVVRVGGEDVRFHTPIVYQTADLSRQGKVGAARLGNPKFEIKNREYVKGRYVFKGAGQVGFEVARYDASRPLVIDPFLLYSSYLGGSSTDTGRGIAVDGFRNAYVTGQTSSADFPRINQIPGVCHGSCGSGADYDVFVTKINAAGDALVYSSYLGGSRDDVGWDIAVDSSGDAYLTGYTESSDFPRVNQIPGACQGTCGSGTNDDAFLAKINAAGDALLNSSLIGGSGDDIISGGGGAGGIALDGSGNIYLTGFTTSSDFPRVNQISGACQGTCGTGANRDVFVTKINAAGDAQVYSSLIGGNGDDGTDGIAVDGAGNAYITGATNSSNFPRVNQISGACNGSCGSGTNRDAFVTKIDAAGTALVYSSYLGGSRDEDMDASGIAVDSSGNAYVTSDTRSTDFPIINQIPGACHGTCGTGANQDAFVTKVNAAGSTLVYSNLLGGSSNDTEFGIAVDGSGDAYVTGQTFSSDFPRLNQIPGACQGRCGTGNGFIDAVVTEINATGNALVYSSYLGGSGGDAGFARSLDGSGNLYVTGYTFSPDFPRVHQILGACNGSCGTGSNSDAFVTEISASGPVMAQSALSRKTHGAAGTFDVPLPLSGNVGVECRSGGATNDYQMIINFMTTVTVGSASVTSGTGSVSSFSVSGSQVTVNLTGVINVQGITVTLFNVNDGTHMGNVSISMGVLVGDVNGDANVNAFDVSLTKAQVGQPVTDSDFREDVNANGSINAADVTQVKANVGTALPP